MLFNNWDQVSDISTMQRMADTLYQYWHRFSFVCLSENHKDQSANWFWPSFICNSSFYWKLIVSPEILSTFICTSAYTYTFSIPRVHTDDFLTGSHNLLKWKAHLAVQLRSLYLEDFIRSEYGADTVNMSMKRKSPQSIETVSQTTCAAALFILLQTLVVTLNLLSILDQGSQLFRNLL